MYDSDAIVTSIGRVIREALREHDIDAYRGADLRELAARRAADNEAHRLVNVELRRERDKANADRDAALDLAAQYARLAGIEEPGLDAALQYVEAYHESWRRIDCDRERLHGQRWEALRLAEQLMDVAAGRRVVAADVTVAEFALRVGEALRKVSTAQDNPKRAPELFPLPKAPGAAA